MFDKILDFKFEANLKILLFIEAFNKIIELINEELDDKLNYIMDIKMNLIKMKLHFVILQVLCK